MNHYPITLHPIAILLLVLFAAIPGHCQDTAIVNEAKEKANSVMSDPRLRNMLRPIKEEPATALESLKEDPEDAVRNATRLFQENKGNIDTAKVKTLTDSIDTTKVKTLTDSIDTTKVKTITDKIEEEGLADKAMSKISEILPEITSDVPATRPAPGISGGIPTPVAMPLEPGGAPSKETPAALTAVTMSPTAVIGDTPVSAIVGASPTTPMIPDTPGLNPADIPEPQPLAKKYGPSSAGTLPSGDKQHMEILSKESIMDNTKGVLLFTGNVFIDHPEFEIKCDKLEIQMAKGVGMEADQGTESTGAFKRAIASGGMVEIKRTALDEEGKQKTQIAIARIADYDAVTKDIVLSGGPPYIQDGDRFVETNSEDAKIIMRGNGKYEITGSTNRVRIVIPVPQKEGEETGGGSTGGGLGNPLSGFR